MTVAVGPVKIAPTHPCVELEIVEPGRRASVYDVGVAYAVKNAIKFIVIHMEAVVVTGKRFSIGKIQGQGGMALP